VTGVRSEEQRELAATVRQLLAKRSDSAAVRSAAGSAEGYDTGLWAALCEQIGVAALAIPEEYDGFGASLVETAVVLEELGENLAPNPLLASTLHAAQLLLHGTEADRAELLPRLAAGEVRPFQLGRVLLEPDRTGDGRTGSMDQTLRLRVEREPVEDPTDVRDIATALVTALQVGTMQRGLAMTVGYSKERVQFGRPIGSFQALKHRCADLAAELEAARSTAYYASWAVDGAPEELPVLAPLARAVCGEALSHIAAESIQLHGGIGFTWEHDAHLYFKRAKASELLAGGFRAQRRLVGARAGIVGSG
jgi:alkylation response protein AidB-like acyl-CoA dehydrogenase